MLEKINPVPCDREPIRIPGSVQPHGVLLIFNRSSHILEHASSNHSQLLPWRQIALGSKAEEFLPPFALKAFEAGSEESESFGQIDGPLGLLDCTGRVQGNSLFIEFEPSLAASVGLSSKAIEEILSTKRLEPLWQIAANRMAEITGYDRVMVYRFDEEWNGQVVAEAKLANEESFFDLHFPAADIPAQARALYAESWVRVIPSVAYEASPLHSLHVLPVDLSASSLRSVSQVHLRYLKNMGVRASASVSLLVGGKLWGLIACHHSEAKYLSFSSRRDMALVGKLVSSQIAALGKALDEGYLDELRKALSQVEKSLKLNFLDKSPSGLNDYLKFARGLSGAAYIRGEKISTAGACPSLKEIEELAEVLAAEFAHSEIITTTKLSTIAPAASSYRELASGLVALRLPATEKSFLLFFKPEVLRTVNWAGKPEKAEDLMQSNGDWYLTPRGSFGAWAESLSGSSLPWSNEELLTFDLLRRAIIEADLARQLAIVERSNDLLDQFSWGVAHDLKEPLRGIKGITEILIDDLSAHPNAEVRGNLNDVLDLAKRANHFLVDLYEYSRVGKVETFLEDLDCAPIIRGAAEWAGIYKESNHVTLRLPETFPHVWGDRVRVKEVFLNLFSNAMKYRNDGQCEISVGWESKGESIRFRVEDNGIGVPSKDRQRVFKLFERLHEAGKYGQGTGAGLAIVQKIVNLHGGEIWIENSSLGGAAFCFTLLRFSGSHSDTALEQKHPLS